MVAGRIGRSHMGFFNWQRAVDAVDWQRVWIESQGIHARAVAANRLDHGHWQEDTCGACLRAALLMEDQ